MCARSECAICVRAPCRLAASWAASLAFASRSPGIAFAAASPTACRAALAVPACSTSSSDAPCWLLPPIRLIASPPMTLHLSPDPRPHWIMQGKRGHCHYVCGRACQCCSINLQLLGDARTVPLANLKPVHGRRVREKMGRTPVALCPCNLLLARHIRTLRRLRRSCCRPHWHLCGPSRHSSLRLGHMIPAPSACRSANDAD